MAITLSIIPTATVCRSGQDVPFMLKVVNTDGAARVVISLGAVNATASGGLAANIRFQLPSDGLEIADAATGYVPFNGAFFQTQSNLPTDALSGVTTFYVQVDVQDTAGAFVSQNDTADFSMSVLPSPNGSTANNQLAPYGQLDFRNFKQTALLYSLGLA